MAGVPTSIIVPFVGVEFDSSRANVGTPVMPFAVGIIGQKLAGGTAVEGNLYQVFTEAEVINLAGLGSMLHNEAREFFANNNITEVYLLPLEDATGTAQTWVLTIGGTSASEAGSLDIEIDGTLVSAPIAVGDTPTVAGDALVAALDDYDYLAWTAGNSTGTVTYTARHDGVAAGDIDLRVSPVPGYKIPAGLTVSIAAGVPGATEPDVQNALDAIGASWLNALVNPYTDDANLGKIEDFLEVNAGPLIQRDGVCYQAYRGTVGELTAAVTASGRNSQFMVFLDCGNRRTTTYQLAAAVAGATAASASEDPAVPLHRMTLRAQKPNVLSERRTLLETNTLAKNGVATLTDDLGVQTQATVTMYLKNSAGALDNSYKQQNTLFNLMELRWSFVNRILTRYPRAKLMTNADRLLPGQEFLTPAKGRAEAIDWFREKEAQGRVQNFELFKASVVCRISESNPNRLEWLLPPDLVKQFIVGSGVMQFA